MLSRKMESDVGSGSVVRDLVNTLGLFAGQHGTNVEHATVTVDSPIPHLPVPPPLPSPERPRPAPVPDSINGYAAAFSREMAGPPRPLPQPAPATTAGIPEASAPPLASNSNDATPVEHLIASDSGRQSPSINDVAYKLESFIDHTNDAMQTLSERSHRLKQDVTENQATMQAVVATHHSHDAQLKRLQSHANIQGEKVTSLSLRLAELEALLRQ